MATSICSICCHAQISDRFYAVLPEEIRPADPRQLNEKEIKTLLDSSFALPGNFINELNILAGKLDKIAENSLDTDNKLSLMYTLANYYTGVDDMKSVYYSKKIIQQAGNDYRYLRFTGPVYLKLTSILIYLEQHDSAARYFYDGLAICRQQKDTSLLLDAYLTLSELYIQSGMFEQALSASDSATGYYTSRWVPSRPFQYIGRMRLFREWFNKTKKEAYADSVIAIARKVLSQYRQDSAYWFSDTYFMLGDLYILKKEYQKALAYYDSSLMKVYLEKSRIYKSNQAHFKTWQRDICRVYLGNPRPGLNLLRQLGKNQFGFRSLVQIALAQQAVAAGEWQNAYYYLYESRKNKDSVKGVQTAGITFEASLRFAVHEKQARIAALENRNLLKQKEKARLVNMGVITGLILLLIIMLLSGLYRRAQIKQKMERQLLTAELYKLEASIEDERQLQLEKIALQRKKIAADIHDEISSGLAAFRFYIIDLKNKAREGETVAMLGDLEAEAQALYQQARMFMKNLNTGNPAGSYDVCILARQLAERFSNEKVLIVKNEIDKYGVGLYFTPVMHYEMCLIIKEAIANSVRHGGASQVIISISFEEHVCSFSIGDNGRGFNLAGASAGLGLHSMKNRIAGIGGQVSIHSNKKGTIVAGSFPV